MSVGFALSVLLLSSSSPAEAPSSAETPSSPAAPATVQMPDLQHAFGLGVSYELREGALWRIKTGEAPALFGEGRPPEHQLPVVAVVADEADHFLTVTEDGLMHHHDDQQWDTLWGLPPLRSRRTILRLPVPMTALRPGRVAYSQRHRHVGYYEDVVGSQFHWGIAGCTSVYVLSEDGQHLLFADPWIPADFSRELMLPVVPSENGEHQVVAESVAASASTVVVIDRAGDVFVRFDDYDHNGGTPFYHYSYAASKPQPLRGDDPASELQVRALPGFAWQQLPPIERTGAARVSRRVAVHQTGIGNAARVVRVAGDNAAGVRGVYELSLDAPTVGWRFVPGDVALDAEEWLSPSTPARVKKPALAYQGFITGPSTKRAELPPGAIVAATDDFWFHDGQFTLTLSAGEHDVRVLVDVVDAWTLFQNHNAATDLQGVKSLKATVRFIDEGTTPAAKAALMPLLRDVVDEPFGAVVVASQDRLTLVPVAYPFNVDGSSWRMELYRVATPTFEPQRHRRFVVDDDDYAVLSREAQMAGALEALLPVATSFADVLTVVTTTRWTLRETYWLTGFEAHMPAVLAAQRLSADLKLRQSVRRQKSE